MKKLLLWLMICLLLPIPALGEDALYPARANGKWGYINADGEMVLAPVWEQAEPFSGNSAMVQGENGWGVIDRQGNILLDPVYPADNIVPYSYIYRLWGEDDEGNPKSAYFDPASGYLSPFIYDYIVDYFRDDPAAPMAVWTEDPPRLTYIIPATGERAFENEYDALYDDAGFHEGYALASNEWIEYDEEGDACAWGPEFHLIDYSGRETVFPEGISPDSQVEDGYLRISRELADEERNTHPSGWGVVYGLAKPDGEIVIAPKYDYLEPPQESCVTIHLDGLLGHIDLETGTVVEPRFYISTGGPLPYYHFWNGYALLNSVEIENRELGQKLIDRKGNEILSLGSQDEYSLASSVFTPGGLCVYQKNRQYGLLKIEDGHVSFLTDAIYDEIMEWDEMGEIENPLAEGWLPVKLNGLWGYINEDAKTVIPPCWEEADLFRNGLARVGKDGKMAYINLQGTVVWQEP